MTTKQLRKEIKKADRVYIIFHEMYVQVTKKSILNTCDEYFNKNDWEVNFKDGFLFIW